MIVLTQTAEKQCQYILALMYANGTGVPQDFKQPNAWSSLTKVQSIEMAKCTFDIVTKKMTKEQIAEAESFSIQIQNRSEANHKD